MGHAGEEVPVQGRHVGQMVTRGPPIRSRRTEKAPGKRRPYQPVRMAGETPLVRKSRPFYLMDDGYAFRNPGHRGFTQIKQHRFRELSGLCAGGMIRSCSLSPLSAAWPELLAGGGSERPREGFGDRND